MAKHKVVFTAAARADLEGILGYIIEQSGHTRTALGFVQRIEARCLNLANAPLGGRQADDILPNMRLVPFESVMIFYMIVDETVRIVGVLHGSRDYTILLKTDPDRR